MKWVAIILYLIRKNMKLGEWFKKKDDQWEIISCSLVITLLWLVATHERNLLSKKNRFLFRFCRLPKCKNIINK